MKKISTLLLVIAVLLGACSQAAPEGSSVPESGAAASVLTVKGGDLEKTYSVEELQALEAAQAEFKGVTYTGVQLSSLLRDAGFDPAQIQAVKAVASDGFTANYEPELANKADTIVAYATVDGGLTAEDGAFRMVLPGQEGRLNVRQLVEIQVIQ